jgi:hypothetical protein
MTSVKFTVYEPETGKVRWTGTCAPNEVEVQVLHHPGLAVLEGEADLQGHYVYQGRLLEKERLVASVIGNTIVGLPMPCTLTVNGQVYQCDDGTAEFNFTYPGTYVVVTESPAYITQTFELHQP